MVELVGEPVDRVHADLSARHYDAEHVGFLKHPWLIRVRCEVGVDLPLKLLRRKAGLAVERRVLELGVQVVAEALEGPPYPLCLCDGTGLSHALHLSIAGGSGDAGRPRLHRPTSSPDASHKGPRWITRSGSPAPDIIPPRRIRS